MQLNWSDVPYHCQNGIIIGFTVFIHDVNNFNFNPIIYMVNDSTSTSYRVYGLTPFDRYNISIAGRTRKGNGDRSEWIDAVQGRKGELIEFQLIVFCRNMLEPIIVVNSLNYRLIYYLLILKYCVPLNINTKPPRKLAMEGKSAS